MPEINVLNRSFPVTLTPNFQLLVSVDGEELLADDRAQLERKVRAKLGSARAVFAISVVFLHDYDYQKARYVRATLRGKNLRNGWALMTIDGHGVQVENPGRVLPGERVSDEQLAELNRLWSARAEAERAHAKYLRELTYDRAGRVLTESVDTLLTRAAEQRAVGGAP